MQYPLNLSFKLLTFGQRIVATDADGNVLMFIKQKMFKLKEKVEIYNDEKLSQLIFRIEADRMLDFSANYSFTDAEGNPWGSVRRKGMRSLWAAHYQVMQEGQVDMEIREESPMKKVLESILGEIPLLGLAAVYLLNPSYIVSRPDGTPLLKLTKKPAVFEGKFVLEKLNDMPEDDELRSLMALLMLVLLERRRG
ncbi:LURP-one-related family protein [Stieleria sp. ICT_E10.1]|uniref:LURP-one-related family protein n=1 Tax=Stieleria sedimenti TaxID=2976331 RepID=UPI0021807447|nr:LURP-one-related family protein [Stieleria sedimenti]MCS7467575.1 LURP-one-related family protein [Stieleria sedimenti]